MQAKRSWMRGHWLATGLLALCGAGGVQAQYTNLHEFVGGASDGAFPHGSLTLSSANLYGMAYIGGASNKGVVFQLNADGSGYTNLHAFAGGVGDGQYPYGSLTLSGTTLYGMTPGGGANNKGVVFRMNADGSGYTNLHEFAGGAGDGASPQQGSLSLSGTTLYGMTFQGGANNKGVVFQLNADGSGYTNLHEFASGAGDGANPYGSLTLSGTNLYGMTYFGGSSDFGVIFKINADGSGYTNLHSFAGGAGDGKWTHGSLTISGTTLYGLTYQGGSNDQGVVFQIQTDGSGYTNLHEFVGGAGDGARPDHGDLTLSGTTLYGMTYQGGASNKGVVFQIQTDGSGYTNLHEFAGGAGDGTQPEASLTLSGTTLYGMTSYGSASNNGVVFALTLPSLLTGAAQPANGGFVTGGGAYAVGANVQLVAAASNGWQFINWNDGATNNPYTITVPATNITYTANFAPSPAQLFFQDGSGWVASWLLATNGAFQASRLLGPAGGWQLRTAGDVDGDGTADLIFQTTDGHVALWFLNPNGAIQHALYVGNTGAWQVRACADYDGNGRPEIFFQHANGLCAYWQTTTNGTCTNAVLLGNANPWQLQTAVELDGDGKADVFWQTASGLVAAWFHNPDGSIRGQLIGATGAWELRAATDVDGDGVGDLAWQTVGGLTAGWFMNSDGTVRAAGFLGATGGWALKAAGR